MHFMDGVVRFLRPTGPPHGLAGQWEGNKKKRKEKKRKDEENASCVVRVAAAVELINGGRPVVTSGPVRPTRPAIVRSLGCQLRRSIRTR